MTTKKEIDLTKELARRLQKKFPSFQIYANKCPSRGKRVKERWMKIFHETCPPLQPEIDLIFLEPQSNGKPIIRAFEIKYFEKKGSVNQSFYKGIEQALALLQWGFDNVGLWQIFDESIPERDVRDYGCRTWRYLHGMLNLPIEYTPLHLVSRTHNMGFQVVQADWANNLYPIPLRDIDDPLFRFSYSQPNPLSTRELREQKYGDIIDAPNIQRILREIDTLKEFLLEWLPEQKNGF